MEIKQANLLVKVWRTGARSKGVLVSQLKAGIYALAYGGLLPAAWRQRLIAQFWENNAAAIHAQWGSSRTVSSQ